RDHWRTLNTLTGKIPLEQQTFLFTQLQHFTKNLVVWLLLNNIMPLPIADIITRIIHPAQKRIAAMQPSEAVTERTKELMEQGLSGDLAGFIAHMDAYSNMFDIVHLAAQNDISEDAVAAIYNTITRKLSGQ